MTARRQVAGIRFAAFRRAILLGLVAMMALGGASGSALGNGDIQREIQGRVVSVNARSRTLVVAREFRGKTSRLTLRAGQGLTVFACGDESPTLDRLKMGMVVSVFYEVLGAEGVANLVVIEPAR
jgi:hypothetical protein